MSRYDRYKRYEEEKTETMPSVKEATEPHTRNGIIKKTNTYINVREEASRMSKKLCIATAGDSVEIIETGVEYTKVKMPRYNVSGYVLTKAIEVVE